MDLTICIVSRGSPRLLTHTTRYYLSLDLRVIVVDGSTEPNSEITGITSPKLDYVWWPDGEIDPHVGLGRRICLALQRVCTRFTAISGDDDYFLCGALTRAVATLAADTRIESVLGRITRVSRREGRLVVQQKYREWRSDSDAELDDPNLRWGKHGRTVNVFSVCRTPALRRTMESTYGFGLSSYHHPFVREFLMLRLGHLLMRTHVLDELTQIRRATISGANPAGSPMYRFYISCSGMPALVELSRHLARVMRLAPGESALRWSRLRSVHVVLRHFVGELWEDLHQIGWTGSGSEAARTVSETEIRQQQFLPDTTRTEEILRALGEAGISASVSDVELIFSPHPT